MVKTLRSGSAAGGPRWCGNRQRVRNQAGSGDVGIVLGIERRPRRTPCEADAGREPDGVNRAPRPLVGEVLGLIGGAFSH